MQTVSALRHLFMIKLGHARLGNGGAADEMPELLFYLGAEALIEVLKTGRPEQLVGTVWELDREVSAAMRTVLARVRGSLTASELFSLESLHHGGNRTGVEPPIGRGASTNGG